MKHRVNAVGSEVITKSSSEIGAAEFCVKTFQNVIGQCLTYSEYKNMCQSDKLKLHNRVRQWSLKARESLPGEHGLFCLVVAHLLRNAHIYFKLEKPSEMQCKILEEYEISDSTKEKVINTFKEMNQKVREVCTLKKQNRVCEQQKLVSELKQNCHSFRKLAKISGVSVKSVHNWCSRPQKKIA